MMQLTIIASLVAATIASVTAWRIQDWRYGKIEAEQIQASNELRLRNERVIQSAATSHEQAKAIIQTKYIKVKEYVNKISYVNRSCLDDDGLQSINSAAKITGITTEPKGAVSAAEPAK